MALWSPFAISSEAEMNVEDPHWLKPKKFEASLLIGPIVWSLENGQILLPNKNWVERLLVQNSVPARLFTVIIIFVINCPSSCGLYTQYQLMWVMHWLSVHLVYIWDMEHELTIEKIHQCGGKLKKKFKRVSRWIHILKLICRLMFSVWAFKLVLALPVAFHDYEDTGTKLRRHFLTLNH